MRLNYILLVLAVIALLLPISARAGQPAVWLCPLDPFDVGGSPQYMKLFQPDAPWTNAAARVDVFKIYWAWLKYASDADLRQQFADLKRRKIELALEYPVLTSDPQLGHVGEGFGGENLLDAAHKIQADGGELRYVAMDEPDFYGTVDFGGRKNIESVQEMADNAAVNVKALWKEFPDVEVGDIEPITNVTGSTSEQLIARYMDCESALRLAFGKPLTFFDADVSWSQPDIVAGLSLLRKALIARNVPFGMIYNGNEQNLTDQSWVDAAGLHAAQTEAAVGQPDFVIFQTWNPHPKKLLPETDTDSLLSVVNRYFEPRTHLALKVTGNTLSGTLSSVPNRPISSAIVQAVVRYHTSGASLQTYTLSGTVPAGATSALLALRFNCEGGHGNADLHVSSLSLERPGQVTVTKDFASPDHGAQWYGAEGAGVWDHNNSAITKLQDGELRVAARPDQTLWLNSQSFPVKPSENYVFDVKAGISWKSVGSGYFAIVFLQGEHEMERHPIDFDSHTFTVAPATTDRNGRWHVALPKSPGGTSEGFHVDAQYVGDANHWPAVAAIDR